MNAKETFARQLMIHRHRRRRRRRHRHRRRLIEKLLAKLAKKCTETESIKYWQKKKFFLKLKRDDIREGQRGEAEGAEETRSMNEKETDGSSEYESNWRRLINFQNSNWSRNNFCLFYISNICCMCLNRITSTHRSIVLCAVSFWMSFRVIIREFSKLFDETVLQSRDLRSSIIFTQIFTFIDGMDKCWIELRRKD
uniref:Uncharacterized protein n=1 Tax=Syphacia muris TaxID=451379 RepID=A0A0N5AFG4_9BILA